MSNGTIYSTSTWSARGKRRDFGLWPTPLSTDGTKGGPNQRDSRGRPALPGAVLLWPTPRVCSGSASSGMNRAEFYRKMGYEKSSTTKGGATHETPDGSLNPTWVEWLLGYPLFWTLT